ncbi:unnamed protein product [Enterobius vermicularis]|uniref:Uncharacterized protein n=1 Tax=Enterobius vermicularis TaxID=51028 RepID=A0A0N4VLL5_ENTVE|nr:unnamed protein product [Enterobius vermicularis]
MKKTRRLPDVYSPLRAETELSFPVLETLVESEEEANGETSDETEGCSGVEIFDSSDTAEQELKAIVKPTNSPPFRRVTFGNHVHTLSSMEQKYSYPSKPSASERTQSAARRASLFVRRVSMAIPSLSADPVPISAPF